MTNEQFIERLLKQFYPENNPINNHAKKLVAVAEAANNITVSASTKDALWEVNVEMMQLEKALENKEVKVWKTNVMLFAEHIQQGYLLDF